MIINLTKISKRFNYHWIFKNLTYSFISGKKYAITGPNGSGKSTLLMAVSNHLTLTDGSITYTLDEKNISPDRFYKYFAWSGPWLDLPEDFTVREVLENHFTFKKIRTGITIDLILDRCNMQSAGDKTLKICSSGMKQRIKLAQALFSDVSLILLDEPTSNLDKSGIDWYLSEINDLPENIIVIIGSNQHHEYSFCDEIIDITVFKS